MMGDHISSREALLREIKATLQPPYSSKAISREEFIAIAKNVLHHCMSQSRESAEWRTDTVKRMVDQHVLSAKTSRGDHSLSAEEQTSRTPVAVEEPQRVPASASSSSSLQAHREALDRIKRRIALQQHDHHCHHPTNEGASHDPTLVPPDHAVLGEYMPSLAAPLAPSSSSCLDGFYVTAPCKAASPYKSSDFTKAVIESGKRRGAASPVLNNATPSRTNERRRVTAVANCESPIPRAPQRQRDPEGSMEDGKAVVCMDVMVEQLGVKLQERQDLFLREGEGRHDVHAAETESRMALVLRRELLSERRHMLEQQQESNKSNDNDGKWLNTTRDDCDSAQQQQQRVTVDYSGILLSQQEKIAQLMADVTRKELLLAKATEEPPQQSRTTTPIRKTKQQQSQKQLHDVGPSKQTVVEFIREMLQPLYNRGELSQTTFVEVVRTVSKDFFARKWKSATAADTARWQDYLQRRLEQTLHVDGKPK